MFEMSMKENNELREFTTLEKQMFYNNVSNQTHFYGYNNFFFFFNSIFTTHFYVIKLSLSYYRMSN